MKTLLLCLFALTLSRAALAEIARSHSLVLNPHARSGSESFQKYFQVSVTMKAADRATSALQKNAG